MDDKLSDRGGKRHYTHGSSRHHNTYSSAASSATTSTDTANNLLHTMRRYTAFPGSSSNSKLKKTSTSKATANISSGNAPNIHTNTHHHHSTAATTTTAFELYSIRDRSDATAKRAFRVQVPVRMMYTISAVFLLVPIVIFGWKEVHMPGVHVHEVAQPRGGRLRQYNNNGISNREDSNWMEEHLVSQQVEEEEGGVGMPGNNDNQTVVLSRNENIELSYPSNNVTEEEASLLVSIQEQESVNENVSNVELIDSDAAQEFDTTEAETILQAEQFQVALVDMDEEHAV